MKIALFLIAALVLGVMAYVRLAPHPAEVFHRTYPAKPAGDYPMEGGFEAVLEVSDPVFTLAYLADAARAAPRTRVLAGSVEEGHISFVTRSLLWGFPDTTNIWINEGRVHIRGHLRFGRSDMGVNEARIRSWMEQGA